MQTEAELHKMLDDAVAELRKHFPDATEIKPVYANGLAMGEVWHGSRAQVVNPENIRA